MVLSNRSQIPQFTESFFFQSGLFKICPDTRYGMDGFLSFRFEITRYGIASIQISKGRYIIGDKDQRPSPALPFPGPWVLENLSSSHFSAIR